MKYGPALYVAFLLKIVEMMVEPLTRHLDCQCPKCQHPASQNRSSND